MLSYSEALGHLAAVAESRAAAMRREKLSLSECATRFSAGLTCARDQNPRFDNSAMDGFLVSSAETLKASDSHPVELAVSGCIAAGAKGEPLASQRCAEIMTGAPIPEGLGDAVVRLEDVELKRDARGNLVAVVLRAPVEPGENVRRAGEDIKPGQTLLGPGTQIQPAHLMALCMAGVSGLEVLARPRVVLLSTGAELVEAEADHLSECQIRNSNSVFLCSMLAHLGAQVQYYGIANDTASALKNTISQMLEEQPDIIITTGGVSAGRFDLVRSVFEELGGRTVFHKVAVRPGKPLLFGEFGPGQAVFFGLPGNPVAVVTGTRFFVQPYLRRLYGAKPEVPERVVLSGHSRKPEGLTSFLRGAREGEKVLVLRGQASFMTASLLEAEGWIVAGPGQSSLTPGDMLDWYPLC